MYARWTDPPRVRVVEQKKGGDSWPPHRVDAIQRLMSGRNPDHDDNSSQIGTLLENLSIA